MSWQLEANCIDADPDLPFGDDLDDDEYYDTMDAVFFAERYCADCPVIQACRKAGESEKSGVWGGQVRASYAAN